MSKHNIIFRGWKYLNTYGASAFLKKVIHYFFRVNSGSKVKRKNLAAVDSDNDACYDVQVSVVIPTYNATDEFEDLLIILSRQVGIRDMQITIVDSGSTDNTVELCKKYDTNLIEIPNSEFSHSYSRNLGAENSKGEFLLFMTQDAMPTDEKWVKKLLSPFFTHDIVAVSCSEKPRQDADLLARIGIWQHNQMLDLESGDRITSDPVLKDGLSYRKNGQLTDVTCLIKKEVFMKYKYEGDYAEDLHMGVRLIKDGYSLGLLSSVQVIHSHNRNASYFLRRSIVEQESLLNILPDYPVAEMSAEVLVTNIIRGFHSLRVLINLICSEFSVSENPNEYFQMIDQKASEPIDFSTIPEREFTLPFISNEGKMIEILNKIKDIYDELETDNIPNNDMHFSNIHYLTNVIAKYVSENYSIVDADLKTEIATTMYKYYSTICGCHLGIYYAQNKGKNDSLIQLINSLNKGI